MDAWSEEQIKEMSEEPDVAMKKLHRALVLLESKNRVPVSAGPLKRGGGAESKGLTLGTHARGREEGRGQEALRREEKGGVNWEQGGRN